MTATKPQPTAKLDRRILGIIDLTGRKFGRLTVSGLAGSTKVGSRLWQCVCDCGRQTRRTTARLTSSRHVSCGCWAREMSSQRASQKHRPMDERFFELFRKDGECWLWTGYIRPNGYGEISEHFGKRRIRMLAHRLSYELHYGPIPTGMSVMHSCDNPRCVNPSHLSIGTNAENTADAAAKGLLPRGERHWGCKLSELEVITIRAASGSHKSIAERFGVSRATITLIKSRQTWAHLSESVVCPS